MFYFDVIGMTEEERKVLFMGMAILLAIVIIGYGIKYLFKKRRKKKNSIKI